MGAGRRAAISAFVTLIAVGAIACGGEETRYGETLRPAPILAGGLRTECDLPLDSRYALGDVEVTLVDAECGRAFVAGPGGGIATTGTPIIRLFLEFASTGSEARVPEVFVRCERGEVVTPEPFFGFDPGKVVDEGSPEEGELTFVLPVTCSEPILYAESGQAFADLMPL